MLDASGSMDDVRPACCLPLTYAGVFETAADDDEVEAALNRFDQRLPPPDEPLLPQTPPDDDAVDAGGAGAGAELTVGAAVDVELDTVEGFASD